MHLSRLAAALATFTTAGVVAAVVTSTAAVATSTSAAPSTTAAVTGTPKIPVPTECFYTSRLQPGQTLSDAQPTGRTLVGIGLGTGSRCNPTDTGYRLVLQPDGNLVEYADGPGVTSAVWVSQTNTANRLVFQSDRNVVLYSADGHALWSTGTAGTAAAYFSVYGNGQLVTQDAQGKVLSATTRAFTPLPGSFVRIVRSPHRAYFLQTQADGNIVEYRYTTSAPQAVWSTGTAGKGAVRLAAQSDGNLVVYQAATGRAVWNSGSRGANAYYQLDLQDDGTVVLYRTDGSRRVQAVWSHGLR